MKKALLLAITFFFASSTFAQPKYIEFKPLDNVVRTPVGTVSGKAKVLPIITWGGDMATIYANGNALTTQSGSLMAEAGLNYRLQRQDDFANQVKAYISGETPFLRGTMGMIASANDVLAKDKRTKPIIFYQETWSAGGDALVVKSSIKNAKDLKGKTIAIQAYGPHVDYITRVLKDSNIKISEVKIKWLPDLTATDNSPMAAFYEKDIDAAFMIIPDALALTSGGNVGTGAEDSVKGARILMSTKTASRVIADVYAVRSDYYDSNKSEINALVSALSKASDKLKAVVSNRNQNSREYNASMKASAKILLDSEAAIADIEGLYADCEFVFARGNVEFFQNTNNVRNFEKLSKEAYEGLSALSLINRANILSKADLDYRLAATGSGSSNQQRFDKDKVAALVSQKQQQGGLEDGELYSFDVFFQPNQNNFSSDLYASEFDRVVELAATYGGAIITVEGHSDPMGYLRAKKSGQDAIVLSRIKQSAKNLSVTRAQSVRDAIVSYAANKHISIDQSQFEAVGHGISQPATGICGQDPCAPKNETEWKSNMRVKFRLIQIEAESDVFMPL